MGHRKLSSEISNKIEWVMKNILDINKALTHCDNGEGEHVRL